MSAMTQNTQTPNPYHQRMKSRLLTTLLVLAVVFGAMTTLLRWSGGSGLLMSDFLWWVTASVLLALWAVHDHGDSVAGELGWDLMLFVFWPLTLLVWLVHTRRLQGFWGYLGCCAVVILPSAVPWVLF